MSIEEIHANALKLPEDQRAKLAGDLLASLPALLVDEDDGVAEAMRRSEDLHVNPNSGVTWEEMKSNLGR
jgi:putative addiction module component (TIGR02574 family)